MLDSSAGGYLSAVLSMVLAGSWQATTKTESVRQHRLHPAVQSVQFMVGIFLASWVAVFDAPSWSFTLPWGTLSAALFMGSLVLNLTLSFPRLGIALGSALASSVAVITSLVWSALVFQQSMRSVAITSLGVLLVIAGLWLFVLTGKSFGTSDAAGCESPPPKQEAEGLLATPGQAQSASDESRLLTGVASAMGAGVFGGSYLVPNMTCCADDGTGFLPSFGVGGLIAAPVFAAVCHGLVPASDDQPLVPPWSVLRDTTPWGVLGGAVVALAIFFIIKAMDDIDYVVANTLAQCSIFVTGLWGWLLYGELRGWEGAGAFFASSAVMVVGACLVGYFGTTD